jgi:A/G-specific adenine glycosylase
VSHIFTHFALTLRLLCAETDQRPEGIWWPIGELDRAGLPTVFAKAAARAASWRAAA